MKLNRKLDNCLDAELRRTTKKRSKSKVHAYNNCELVMIIKFLFVQVQFDITDTDGTGDISAVKENVQEINQVPQGIVPLQCNFYCLHVQIPWKCVWETVRFNMYL